jgi:predicted GNAT family acetyltransferase
VGVAWGRRVAQAVVRGIREDGGQPFLHVMRTNPARRLYEAMGFTAVRAVRVIPLQRVGA